MRLCSVLGRIVPCGSGDGLVGGSGAGRGLVSRASFAENPETH